MDEMEKQMVEQAKQLGKLLREVGIAFAAYCALKHEESEFAVIKDILHDLCKCSNEVMHFVEIRLHENGIQTTYTAVDCEHRPDYLERNE